MANGENIETSFLRRRFAGEAAALLGTVAVGDGDEIADALEELNDRLRELLPREIHFEGQFNFGGDREN